MSPATMPSLASTLPSSSTLKLLFRKAELASKEKSRAFAVALNAVIRRTKARLLKEVPKLQRLAVKKIHRRKLQGAVESVESLRGATVEPFGSFVSELFTRWGDLDVSIEFSKGAYISSYGRKHTQDVLKDLMKAMRKRGGWNRYQFIPNARVPILMVKSNLGNISCDISVNNLKGQMKSKLFLWMNDIDPCFRDMVLLVKEWAKAHNINNSKSGTFNSYSLSLLVIFHFQTCTPAILPPLQDIYTETLTDDLKEYSTQHQSKGTLFYEAKI
ncbi:hypothetical protein ABKV19_004896 [Rosa sericea]